MSGVNPLEMSDEDILNMVGPESLGSGEAVDAAPTNSEAGAGEAVVDPEGGAADPSGDNGSAAGDADPANPLDTPDDELGEKPADPAPADPKPEENPAETPAEKPVDAVEPKADEKPADKPEVKLPTPEEATAFYQQIMKPFKANGKMIELKSPEEAISLMQMGANYTRRMQELAPHRKTLLMLQNNNLDQEQLSFLIDLNKGDPEAVKKFIKDRGIDPMDIDTATDPAYLGGTNLVSDEEASFRATLEELSSTPEGKNTLIEVNTRWDSASKELLWQNPEVLQAITEQRETGVYDAIVAEMDRQITLGKLPASTPFLHAYKAVGDQLVEQYTKAPGGQAAPAQAPVTPPAPQVLDTRAAAPKAAVTNAEQVAAAAPSRGTATKPKEIVNFLDMKDDDFLKQFDGRV